MEAARLNPILERRRAERELLIGTAGAYLRALAERLDVRAGIVVGSVARGDFNVWSDIDLVVIAESLPDRLPDRLAALNDFSPPRVQVVGYTPAEFVRALERRNRMAVEAVERGVLLMGVLPAQIG